MTKHDLASRGSNNPQELVQRAVLGRKRYEIDAAREGQRPGPSWPATSTSSGSAPLPLPQGGRSAERPPHPHRNAFFFGNHRGIGQVEREAMK